MNSKPFRMATHMTRRSVPDFDVDEPIPFELVDPDAPIPYTLTSETMTDDQVDDDGSNQPGVRRAAL